MRHRRKGRVLGRSPSHRKAMFKNLASALFLTEMNDAHTETYYKSEAKRTMPTAKMPGRIITTLAKAKEIRPLVERCITIAKRSMKHAKAAEPFTTTAKKGTPEWKKWREGAQWQSWAKAIAPVVAARRKVLQLLGDKIAMRLVFDTVAPRFVDRVGGYTRVLKLATPRLGDSGPRAILEFTGVRDRVVQKSEKPAFSDS